jgi:small subunit ribosomal protein S4
MGDPKKISNKFQKPMHPWNKARLEQERPLMITYGLESKKELWKITSKLKTYKQNAKRLVALKSAQAEKEREQIFAKLKSYNLITGNNVDEILGLKAEQLLDRRLQTVVFKKGLARTIKQARQMITHRHVTVNGTKITAPGYLVRLAEEHTVAFYPGSNFFREDHPERPVKEQVPGRSETNVESRKVESKVEYKEVKHEDKESKSEAKPKKTVTKKKVAKVEAESSDEKVEEVEEESTKKVEGEN